MLNTNYLDSVKMKITIQWAMSYDPGMHRVLGYTTVLFLHCHLEVKYIKSVAEYLNTVHKLSFVRILLLIK